MDGWVNVDVSVCVSLKRVSCRVTVHPLPYCMSLSCYDAFLWSHLSGTTSRLTFCFALLLPDIMMRAYFFLWQVQPCKKTRTHMQKAVSLLHPIERYIHITVGRSRLFAKLLFVWFAFFSFLVLGWSLSVSHQRIREQGTCKEVHQSYVS